MNRKKFFEKLPKRFTGRDRVKIAQAYWLAKETHRMQKRRTGERYFEHCRRVARCLLKNRSRDIAPHEIITALIHDCDEDGFIPKELVMRLFGKRIANALETLSKVTLLHHKATGCVRKIKKGNRQYYDAILNAPPWIRRIKIADRIDNLKDITSRVAWTDKKRKEYLEETQRYILPLAQPTDECMYRLLKRKIKI